MAVDYSRLVVVDDTSQEINYVGSSWFADSTGSLDGQGNFGAPYRSTLHGTRSNGSLFFTFTGTEVTIFGTTYIRNDSGIIDPQLECAIDNIGISSREPFPYPENNWWLCTKSNLVNGPHTITVNATVLKNQTFWLDRIEYKPSIERDYENHAIRIPRNYPTLQFGPGWLPLGDLENFTTTTGAALQYEFHGTSLSWYGSIPQELPGEQAMATYSVDGGPPSSFLLKGHPSGPSNTQYYQKFFETATYEMGRHNLTVIHQGGPRTTPLTLAYLVVQNGTSPAVPIPPATTSSAKSPNIGGIVGGVIGAVLAVIFAVLVYFCLLRKFRRSRRLAEKYLSPSSTPIVQPFRYIPAQPRFPHPSYSVDPSRPSTWASSQPLTLNMSTAQIGHLSNMYPVSEDYTNESPILGVSPITGPVPFYPTSTKARSQFSHSRSAISPLPPRTETDVSLRSAAGSGRFLLHIDSGYRLRGEDSTGLETVEEIPPEYTMG